MNEELEYLNNKRNEVLEAIKPICDVFNIECDYIVKEEGQKETLVLNGQKIGCSCNSINATIEELIAYIFVKRYVRNRYLGTFQTQTLNVIKQFWIN